MFTEVESGRRGDRPELAKALAYCKRHKGTKLIVAALSRLTRDTRFLLTLLDGNVAVAELEAGLVSERIGGVLRRGS